MLSVQEAIESHKQEIERMSGNEALSRLNYILFETGVAEADRENSITLEKVQQDLIEIASIALTGKTGQLKDIDRHAMRPLFYASQIDEITRKMNSATSTQAFIDVASIALRNAPF